MDLGLKGKTTLVTGASEGIGSAVARKLGDLVVDGSKSVVI